MRVAFLLCLFLLLATSCLAEMLSVVYQPAELRDRPLVAGSKTLRQLPLYTPLELLDKSGEYFKVKDVDGITGYIHKSLTQKHSSLIVTADLCNVRSGPGTEFPSLFKTKKGESFLVLGKQGEWIEIAGKSNQSGWIWQNLTWGY